MEIRSIDKAFAWPFVPPQYQHNHEEWDEDLNNDEVEHVLPQHAKIVFQIENMEGQVFVTKAIYQTKV